MSYLRAIVLLPLVALMGCAQHRDMTFRVVDAETGQPIPDVQSSLSTKMWRPAMPGLFPVCLKWPDHSTAIMTDTEGTAHFSEVPSDQRIWFEKDGFETIRTEQIWPSVELHDHSDGSTSDEEIIDGAIVVRMKRTATVGE